MTNEHQQRALWAAALTSLAQAVTAGIANPPTNIKLYTQYVNLPELLNIADTSYSRSLEIRYAGDSAWVNVPVGELLGLNIEWTTMTRLPEERGPRDEVLVAIQRHNEVCVPAVTEEVPA